ncbi:heterokaryon incompatibility protein-domain-containing protein [Mycena olivaceomarginata]|nr:heterokaryon incompatibility protein-domain-containing protein [Mycena olivaceomarginata]
MSHRQTSSDVMLSAPCPLIPRSEVSFARPVGPQYSPKNHSTLSGALLRLSTGLTYQTPSWARMQESIEHMCEWCDLVCEEIEFYYQHKTKTKTPPPGDATFSITVFVRPPTEDSPLCLRLSVENDWTPTRIVHANDGDPAARYISARGVVWEMNNSSTFNLALQCVKDCSSHERCPPPEASQLPTRALYVALSYVWGEEQPHSTTLENFESYTVAIDLVLIPKTICDAITVTHKLGLRYLWVDAFCIIQNSDDDKTQQIPMIRAVFRNAFITIVAAGAKRANGSVGTMFLEGGAGPPDEPVDTRAWCLEERVLSPRILMYCTHALQYECQSVRINVNGSPSFLPTARDIPRLPDCVFSPQKAEQVSERTLQTSWRDVLCLYTQRALTKSKDRLVAFSAIAEQFHELWPQSSYLAGLPPVEPVKSRQHPRPSTYRGPSWSWAAMDGEVQAFCGSTKGCLCTITDLQKS